MKSELWKTYQSREWVLFSGEEIHWKQAWGRQRERRRGTSGRCNNNEEAVQEEKLQSGESQKVTQKVWNPSIYRDLKP